MLNRIMGDILDVRYATPNNLYVPSASTSHGAVNQVMVNLNKLLTAGYIRPLEKDIPSRENRRQQFYSATFKGAQFANREEDYRPTDRKASSSVKHESIKVDIALSFKRLYGADEFVYGEKVGSYDYKGQRRGITPDIIIKTPFKAFIEIEVKDNYSKIITSMKKYEAEGVPVLVVCCPYEHNPLLRHQDHKPDEYAMARDYLAVISRKFAKKPRFIFTHHIFYNRLDENVWYQAGKAKTLV
jgi:hypothetical protein